MKMDMMKTEHLSNAGGEGRSTVRLRSKLLAAAFLSGLALAVACGGNYTNRSGQTYTAKEGEMLQAKNNSPKLISIDESGITIQKVEGYPHIRIARDNREYDLGNKEKLVIVEIDPKEKILTYEMHQRGKMDPFDF